ncbi:MAG: hypothetical protein ACFFD5_12640 [Candidatus Thorarchaeota archaeon]
MKITFNANRENKKDLSNLKTWDRLKWLFLGSGPLLFLIRAISMALEGGDSFSKINPIASWTLLLVEICLSGITGVNGLILWIRGPKIERDYKFINLLSWKTFLYAVIITYIIHLTRVAIWIIICVM